MAVDIACPRGWGYYCESEEEPAICEKGYFCETPGSEVICPVEHTCKNGSTYPMPCEWWEVCTEEGRARPGRVSAIFFSMIIVTIVVGFLIIVTILFRRYMKYYNRVLDDHKDDRFNPFSHRQSELSAATISKASSEGSEG